jgi:hypothetical protein
MYRILATLKIQEGIVHCSALGRTEEQAVASEIRRTGKNLLLKT